MDPKQQHRISQVLFGNGKSSLLLDVASLAGFLTTDYEMGEMIWRILKETDMDTAARAMHVLLLSCPKETIHAAIKAFTREAEEPGKVPTIEGLVGFLTGLFEGSEEYLRDEDGCPEDALEESLITLVASIVLCRDSTLIARYPWPKEIDRLDKAIKAWVHRVPQRLVPLAREIGSPSFNPSLMAHAICDSLVYGWVKATPSFRALQSFGLRAK